MASFDLREYLAKLSEADELRTVEGAHWDLEIGTLCELCGEREGPALLFDAIPGYPRSYRVATNLFDTPRRMAILLGQPPDLSNMAVVRALKERLKDPKLLPPRVVDKGPVMEKVFTGDQIDLEGLPTPRWHELDGGRYLGTGDMVIMRDPEEGWVNVGTYRVQLHDKTTLGIYISEGHQGALIRRKYWAQGQNCPVAVVFGAHPLVWLPSMLAIPWGTCELEIAGHLMGEPVPVVTGPDTGLPIPAHAEIAIEGEIPPPEEASREEGPFGEWPGYYATGSRKECVIRVKRLMHRKDPIILGIPPLKPPATSGGAHMVRAAQLWNELERLGIRDVVGVWKLRGGGERYWNVVSIRQRFAGHAKQAALAAMSGPDSAQTCKYSVVVDEDIDPSNTDEVIWAMSTRCDPASDIDIIRHGWTTGVDPGVSPEQRAHRDYTNSRAAIVACKPFTWKDQFPAVNRASPELRESTLRKWGSVLGVLSRQGA